jgi:hypothetical protein
LNIGGQAGTTVWTDDFKDVAGKTLRVGVGSNSALDYTYESSCEVKGTSRRISTVGGQTTVPAGYSTRQPQNIVTAQAIQYVADNNWRVFINSSFYGTRGSITPATRGSYRGNSTMVGSLLGEAGSVYPSDLLSPLVADPNAEVTLADNQMNVLRLYSRGIHGAVYIEYTINTPY